MSVIALAVASACFRDDLERLRNLVLMWGAPLATGVAVWRSMVAQRQSEAVQQHAAGAQRGLLADRYQRTLAMLGHELDSLRIGGLPALVELAREHPDESERRGVKLLSISSPLQMDLRPAQQRIQVTRDDAFVTLFGPQKSTEPLPA